MKRCEIAEIVAVGMMMTWVAGCSPARTSGRDWEVSRPAGVSPGPETPTDRPPEADRPARSDVVSGHGAVLKGRYSDEEKQQAVETALLNLQRCIISTEEALELSGGVEGSTAAKETLTTTLAELGFMVIESTKDLPFSPSEPDQERFRAHNDCNLVFLISGSAKPMDRFGNFHSFESQLTMKVLNLTTHQVLASKTFLKRGKRALDERQAAEDANRAAASELAKYLTDEVVRKWEATSLIRMELVVAHIEEIAQADDIRLGLQRRPGVYYASLDQWDDGTETAFYEVLCRFDVQRHLAAYVDELRRGKVQVKDFRAAGKAIEARRRHGG